MKCKVQLYSTKNGEINKFLKEFLGKDIYLENSLKWEDDYENPLDLVEIIGGFIDNNDRFNITMWISIDEGVLINVTDSNTDDIIKYLYERFPY